MTSSFVPDSYQSGGQFSQPAQKNNGSSFEPDTHLSSGGGQYSVGGFLNNIVPSGSKFLGNLLNMATHPVKTAKNLVALPFGEGEALVHHLTGNTVNPSAFGAKQAQGALDEANQFNQYMGNRYGGINQIGNTLYNDPVGAAVDASSLLDGGDSAVGSLADLTKSNALAKTANVMGKTSAVTNPLNIMPLLLKAGGKANQIIGDSIIGSGESLPLKGLNATPTQMTNFSKTGMHLQDFMNKNNITGDFQATAQNKLDELYPQYDQLATNTNTTVPYSNIQKAFQPLIDEWGKSTLSTLKGKAEDLQGYLDNVKNKYGDNLNISDVVGERQQADNLLKQNAFNNSNLPPEQTMMYKNIRDNLKGVIDTATGGQTKNIGTQINQWKHFKDIADNQINSGKSAKPVTRLANAANTAAQGLGAFFGGVPGWGIAKGAEPIISNIASNPKLISAEAKTTQAIGKGVKGIGNGQMWVGNNPGMNYLMSLLRNASSANQNINGAQNQ